MNDDEWREPKVYQMYSVKYKFKEEGLVKGENRSELMEIYKTHRGKDSKIIFTAKLATYSLFYYFFNSSSFYTFTKNPLYDMFLLIVVPIGFYLHNFEYRVWNQICEGDFDIYSSNKLSWEERWEIENEDLEIE